MARRDGTKSFMERNVVRVRDAGFIALSAVGDGDYAARVRLSRRGDFELAARAGAHRLGSCRHPLAALHHLAAAPRAKNQTPGDGEDERDGDEDGYKPGGDLHAHNLHFSET
ncbi:MAG TPA: hypothetical protein VGR67_05265 [Candidatus Polarisedimenticolia bacterium]|jgi:hypothetical protein|nr:hypothetical protein [Candidatus Polarisedimenticolia bacterium]